MKIYVCVCVYFNMHIYIYVDTLICIFFYQTLKKATYMAGNLGVYVLFLIFFIHLIMVSTYRV